MPTPPGAAAAVAGPMKIGSDDTTLVQQKQDVQTNIPQAVLDLEKKSKKSVEKPKE